MSKKLFVGNLAYQADEAAVLDLFRQAGFNPLNAHVVLDRDTGRPRGFAFVEFESDDEASNAQSTCDGQPVMGRNVRIDQANERPARGGPRSGGPRRERL